MNYITWSKRTDLGRLWALTKFVLTICSFFWFGWQVGILMLVMGIDYD